MKVVKVLFIYFPPHIHTVYTHHPSLIRLVSEPNKHAKIIDVPLAPLAQNTDPVRGPAAHSI